MTDAAISLRDNMRLPRPYRVARHSLAMTTGGAFSTQRERLAAPQSAMREPTRRKASGWGTEERKRLGSAYGDETNLRRYPLQSPLLREDLGVCY